MFVASDFAGAPVIVLAGTEVSVSQAWGAGEPLGPN